MKTCIFIMAIAMGMMSACNRKPSVPKGEFLIQGELKDVPDGTVLRLDKSNKGLIETLARDTLKDGKFSFRDTISSLRNLMIGSMDQGFPPDWLEVWVKPGTYMRITGKSKLILSWRVESDVPEQADENSFVDCLMPEQMEMMAYMADEYDWLKKAYFFPADDVDAAFKKKARAKVDSIRKLEKPLQAVLTKKELNFMKTAPVSKTWMKRMLWFTSLLHTGRMPYEAELKELYTRIPEAERQTVNGQAITKYLFPLPTVEVGDQMVDGDLYDMEGKLRHLSEFKGRYILLDFWSLGCGACVYSVPVVKRICSQYADRLTVVCINENLEKDWKKYVVEEKLEGNQWNELLPANTGLSARYNIDGIPAFVLISPDGIILEKCSGYSSLVESVTKHLSQR